MPVEHGHSHRSCGLKGYYDYWRPHEATTTTGTQETTIAQKTIAGISAPQGRLSSIPQLSQPPPQVDRPTWTGVSHRECQWRRADVKADPYAEAHIARARPADASFRSGRRRGSRRGFTSGNAIK